MLFARKNKILQDNKLIDKDTIINLQGDAHDFLNVVNINDSKKEEKRCKNYAKMEWRKKDPPKREFSGVFVDFRQFWVPAGGAKSTENSKIAS